MNTEQAQTDLRIDVIKGKVAHVDVGAKTFREWPLSEYRMIDQGYDTIVCWVDSDLDYMKDGDDDYPGFIKAKEILTDLDKKGIVVAFLHP